MCDEYIPIYKKNKATMAIY